VHSGAVQHVLDDDVVEAGDTGWACMRWLVPRDELLVDPETADMIQESATRYFTAAQGAAGLVWYPCRKCVDSLPFFSFSFDEHQWRIVLICPHLDDI
jgi:salicylate hydroxylase